MTTKVYLHQSCFVILALSICVVLCVPFQNKDGRVVLKRQARNLHQFGNMVNCMTNRSRFDFTDYGCWCGAGGKGRAVDGTDKCCEIHDKCYNAVMYDSCYFPFHVYTAVYQYQGCRQCDPISSYPVWEDKWDVKCKKGTCECDSAAALCFSQASYNSSYVNYDTSKC